MATKTESRKGLLPKQKSSAEKEFQKLRRVDLLELLLDQIRENEEQSAQLAELIELTARLKSRLDQKDAQIEHLKERLNHKDAEIQRIHEHNQASAHAGGTVDVHELLEVQRRAAEMYLEQVASQNAGQNASQNASMGSTVL